MVIDFKVPWEQYGMISYLTGEMEKFNVQFGKTSLQKIIYILQEVYDISIGYTYILYNYGPFSADLASDLDYVAALKGVEVSWANTGGYSIKSGIDANAFIGKSKSFVDSNEGKIKRALDIFGGMTAKELELRATIIYFVKKHDESDENNIAVKIHQLKPYFDEEQIRETVIELKNNSII